MDGSFSLVTLGKLLSRSTELTETERVAVIAALPQLLPRLANRAPRFVARASALWDSVADIELVLVPAALGVATLVARAPLTSAQARALGAPTSRDDAASHPWSFRLGDLPSLWRSSPFRLATEQELTTPAIAPSPHELVHIGAGGRGGTWFDPLTDRFVSGPIPAIAVIRVAIDLGPYLFLAAPAPRAKAPRDDRRAVTWPREVLDERFAHAADFAQKYLKRHGHWHLSSFPDPMLTTDGELVVFIDRHDAPANEDDVAMQIGDSYYREFPDRRSFVRFRGNYQ